VSTPRHCLPLLLLAAAPGWAQPAPKTSLRVYLVVSCSDADAGRRVAADCLEKKPFLTQTDVQSAEVQKNRKGQPVVFITFHPDAAVRELNVTLKNIGNRVAIVVDGKVVSTPVIASGSRQLYIEGAYTEKQAEEIAAGLNRGWSRKH